MLRLMSYGRDKSTVPSHILGFTNNDKEQDSFVAPHSSVIKGYKIAVTTVAYGGKLVNHGVLDHFTHVF